MSRHILFFILIFSSFLRAQVPAPRETIAEEGTMTIDVNTAVLAPDALAGEATILIKSLGKLTSFQHRFLAPRLARHLQNEIVLEIDPSLPEGEYTLTIGRESASIKGRDGEAILYGVQTMSQLLPIGTSRQQSVRLPCLTIKDSPVTKRRIIFIDTVRHLMPVDAMKQLLDWMSYHKLNELHLHFNDDQGWRLEIERFSKLTKVGSLRASTPPYSNQDDDPEEYGGYYSQKNIKELITYASQRHIKIIPGFAIPTHASALLAAYPELGNDDLPGYEPKVKSTWGVFPDTLAPKKETYEFLDALFAEVATLFPADEVRIYAPDVPWTEWENSPNAQKYLKANKLAASADLRDHFLEKIDTILAKHKRKRLDPNSIPAIDFSTYQRPSELELKEDPTREAVSPLVSLFDAYQFSKAPAAQAILWTELVHDEEKFFYQLFPRLAGFAEATWSAPASENFKPFLTRLQPVLRAYQNADLDTAEVYLALKREALQGAIVTTDIPHRGDHWPELSFDGNLDSFFQSRGGLKKGNHLTFEFAFPVDGKMTFSTGGDKKGALVAGILESSIDGKNWSAPTSFANGLAAIDLPRGSKFVRLKVTASQADPLVFEELQLSEPLLPPVVKDVRMTEFKPVDQNGNHLKAMLTFEADFSKHPDLRDQIRAMRHRFFLSTPRLMELANLVGRQHSVHYRVQIGEKTSASENLLTINADDLGKLSPFDAEDLLLTHLVSYLQDFSNVAPKWFASGMSAYFRQKEIPESTWASNVPKNFDRSQALAGGPDSAAFLNWLVSQHTEVPIQSASLSFRKGFNNPLVWKGSTGNKTLPELVQEYQN